MPKLIVTTDFYHFKVNPIHGECVQNKGMALFPEKIKGQYAMLSRLDGLNNYVMFSKDITVWHDAHKIQGPQYPWEFIQIGNCGSPLETEVGWLLLTHGVGPLRKYCIGVQLLDLNDPSRVIGSLEDPLIMPNEYEREGYVPNMVYTCGALLHNNNTLVIPYAVSDTTSGFATIELKPLLKRLLQ